MKYIDFVNGLIKEEISRQKKIVLFGQNINAGSCLGGLTKGITVDNSSMVINSTNSENTLCGFGFGLMMNGVSSIFFMKQLDFLLIGIDHLVNTYNIIRGTKPDSSSSFTIFPIVVDNGFQGPQSSLNNFADFCSISRIRGFTITNKIDAEKIIRSQLISPGFRIITVSQRLFKEEILIPEKLVYVNSDCDVFQYSEGDDSTIVCFNFSFPFGMSILEEMKINKISGSLFNVNSPVPVNWKKIVEDVRKTKRLIVIDDSKSENLACDALLADICGSYNIEKKIVLKRDMTKPDWVYPVHDQMEINVKQVVKDVMS
ncbi:MAG: hypothetical protein ACREA3_05315 [Nitrosotalea sp.]